VSGGWGQNRGSAWPRLRRIVLRRDAGVCQLCGLTGADRVDHIIPKCRGGSDHPSNLQAVHQHPCHDRKTASEAATPWRHRTARPIERHPGLT